MDLEQSDIWSNCNAWNFCRKTNERGGGEPEKGSEDIVDNRIDFDRCSSVVEFANACYKASVDRQYDIVVRWILLFVMAFFYYWIDYKGRIWGLNWLKIYGMNSIAAYLLGEVINFRCVAASVSYGLEQYLGDYYQVWLTFANYLILFFILRAMYKCGLFLKV